ncbi:MAG TPA: hypothetical protein VMH33_04780 [Solirubrobacterales bacterium]|nr:hypothetical protein [Solirubrobacterales bacterium]
MYRSTVARPAPTGAAAVRTRPDADPYRLACEVAEVLGRMSFDERVGAYRARVFSPHALAVAAAWLPGEMPLLDGEFEWIAHDLE